MRTKSILRFTLLAGMVATLTGCLDFILPLEPRNTGPKTDQYRLVMEYVPDADLVTEDASPLWELGRHAFTKGSDRLIVVGRYTSYADKDENGEPIAGTERDRKLERVWINIPGDIELGKAIKMEELEDEFATGYDVDNLDGKGAFVGPHLMKGYMNVLEVTETTATVLFDIEMRPNRPFQAENWKITGRHTFPVVPEGRIASKAISRDIEVSSVKPPVEPDKGAATGPVAANDGNPDTSDNATGDDPKPTTVATDDAAPSTDDKAADNKDRSVVGKWVVDTRRFEYRFQFEPNGRFVYATTRGDGINDDYAPGMRYGTYQIKKAPNSDQEWVVMLVEKFEIDGRSSIDSYGDNPTLMLRIDWKDQKLVLTGEMPINNNQLTRLELDKGNFEDMHKVLPPRGRKKTVGSARP